MKASHVSLGSDNDLLPLILGFLGEKMMTQLDNRTNLDPVGSASPGNVYRDKLAAFVDPMGIVVPVLHAQIAWLLHPQELQEQLADFWGDCWRLASHAARRLVGAYEEDPVAPQPDDARFSDPAWTDQASWDVLKEWYLLSTRRIQDMLFVTPGLSEKERRRAAFWTRKYLNAVSPTNFFWSNPVAIRRAQESNGATVNRGVNNFLRDWDVGTIRMTDPDGFQVGRNLATTSGTVVARNSLVELIRYRPTQEKVRRTPLLIVTPWINKFYILDLTAKRSMIRFMLDQGFDVFVTSWKNPDESMRNVSFESYLVDGVDYAIRSVQTMADKSQVNVAGYCIGGTALSIYMAWMQKAYSPDAIPVRSWTLFTTLTDFSSPGDIDVFIDEGSVAYLCEVMRRRGYLDGEEMAAAFRLLRSNSLIWHYYVQSYLYGEAPEPFDILFWNMDTTRMPAAMHSWYLRELYLKNNLIAKEALHLAGQAIDLGCIAEPLYAVGAEDDHIAPWRQTFRVNNLVGCEKRYVLSSSGHILGIVNPVVTPPKRRYFAGEAHRSDTPERWLERQSVGQGSWWPDWVDWLSGHSGEYIAAPQVVADHSLGAAPGEYVLEP